MIMLHVTADIGSWRITYDGTPDGVGAWLVQWWHFVEALHWSPIVIREISFVDVDKLKAK